MSSYALDFGFESEDNFLAELKEHCPDMEKTEQMSPVDFISFKKRVVIELKTRRITHDKYDTAPLPLSKINSMRTLWFCGIQCYCVWKYTDKTVYMPYQKLREYIHTAKMFNPHRATRPQKCVFIDTDKMKVLNIADLFE